MPTAELNELQQTINILWLMVAAALVFLMQAGFAALESGLTRAKNTINVALKNITDFTVATVVFWLVGFALMFGDSVSGWFGSSNFAISEADTPMDFAFFMFQVTFAGTAATIVSGAVAERIRFLAYMIITIAICAFIYPVSGHWIWGEGGWLAEKNMVDFAGSTVVHSLGGWVGLAGAWILGPRLGRFNPDGRTVRMQGHNQVMAVIGVLILWFGWFGFNGGSTLEATPDVAKIILNTSLAAAAGGVASFLISLFLHGGEIYIARLLNGIIGGLVAITAGCAVVDPMGAAFIGLSAGVVVYGFEWWMVKGLRIDDPVNVVASHGFCGAWGTLILAFVAADGALPIANRWEQFFVQAQGVIAVFIWGFGTGAILFGIMRYMKFLRVPEEAERVGLNVYEHGTTTGLIEIKQAMKSILPKSEGGEGDLTTRVPFEQGSDAGEIAQAFNTLVDSYYNTVKYLNSASAKLNQTGESLNNTCASLNQSAKDQTYNSDKVLSTVQEMVNMTNQVTEYANEIYERTLKVCEEASQNRSIVNSATHAIETLSNDVIEAAEVIHQLKNDSNEISQISDTINDISDQTNLLALNASIEAARAGEHGRGFAVVAEEVRELAQRASNSTEQIKQMIDKIQAGAIKAAEAMEQGAENASASVNQAKQMGESLNRISDNVENITELTQLSCNQLNTYKEVTHTIETDLSTINHLAKEGNLRADETEQTSSSLSELIREIHGIINQFQVSNSNEKAAVAK
ncbi:ammonium transporter [Spartinivicinus poritis]|uniref:Ammonium transporter n=1 Tax=Spartinivicinus poritis TaxID=2994640 RepID=A0ABT5UF07_9GAMM|nr:ammonium transporter [Spartinivicinus sp. A2-2]MDE1464973.1 ammonium transporter [Spartinivicinus sp. A2-2]